MIISVIQFQVGLSESIKKFLNRLRRCVEDGARNGSELVIFPEYICVDLLSEVYRRLGTSNGARIRDLVRALPTLNEEVFEGISDISNDLGVALVAGTYMNPDENGAPRNAAEIFLPGQGHFPQPKLHIAYELVVNADDVVPGDVIRVFELNGRVLAVMVCYDAQFPETARAIVDSIYQPELLVVPGCALEPWGIGRLRTAAASRAMESLSFVATAHLVGSIDIPGVWEQEFWGQSLICSPISRPFAHDGVLRSAEPNREEVLTVDLDMEKLHESWEVGFPRLEDRKKSLFRVDHRDIAKGMNFHSN